MPSYVGNGGKPAMVRYPITVRLDPQDKETFCSSAEEIGLEPGTAGRQIIEIVCQRIRAGEDLLDVVKLLKSRPVVRVQAGKAP